MFTTSLTTFHCMVCHTFMPFLIQSLHQSNQSLSCNCYGLIYANCKVTKTCVHNGMLVHENEFRDKDFYGFCTLICQIASARRQPSDTFYYQFNHSKVDFCTLICQVASARRQPSDTFYYQFNHSSVDCRGNSVKCFAQGHNK